MRQRGSVELILIFVVLLAMVGGGAYYFGTQKDKGSFTDEFGMPIFNPSVDKKEDVSKMPENDETANWKTYTSTNLGFSLKYPSNIGYLIEEKDSSYGNGKCVDWGVPETDDGFSVCLADSKGLNLKKWLETQTVTPPSCMGIYGSCGESALNYGDLKLTEMTIDMRSATKVEQTQKSIEAKYNVIRTPKIYIYTKDNQKIYIIDGTYNDKILSTFKFTP